MLTHTPNGHEALLAAIVKETKSPVGYTFQYPSVIAPLVALKLVETNAGVMRQDEIATRATADGIKHITLYQWEMAKATLEEAKARELELRNEVVALFSDPNKKKGTENVKLDDGATVKIVKKVNYLLDKDIDKVEQALDQIEALAPEYKLVADRLVKWKADLSVTEYNKLEELGADGVAIKKLIDGVLEVKDGTPTVELVEPKTKK